MKAKELSWRAAAPAPVVLFFGPADFFATRAIKSIRKQLTDKLGSIETERISAADYSAGQLASISAPSLFAEPKCIIVEQVEKCSDDFIADGIAYVAKPDPDVTLILQHDGSSVRGKKLLEAIRASGSAVEIAVAKPNDKEGEAFVVAEFQAAGRQIQPQAVRALAAAFGSSFEEIAAACEQLMQATTESVTETLVDQYYGGRVEVTVWKILDAAQAGRKAEALEYLRHALGAGADKVGLVSGVALSVRSMAKVMGATNTASLGMPSWQVNKARSALAGWSEENLAKLINAVAEADAAMKGASRDPEFVLEQLVLLIANKGKQ
ncbi:MAG: DNA polymerase III subunit delta [Micrococcales bacterium]